MKEPYYMAYEKRYQAVFSSGAERWGHSPDDEMLYNTLKSWVEENNLQGKSIIEYACGEGACGVILSELGCIYHGVDISPSVIEKSKELLKKYPNATVEVLDMVKESVTGKFDAALDCMGFHMLVTDNDRNCYLKNAYDSLKENAPMLFFRESYRKNGAYQGVVNTVEEWELITGDDYKTPQLRQVRNSDDGGIVEVFVPLIPARAKDKTGYVEEFENVGFDVEKFIEMDVSTAIPHSASIYVRKVKADIPTSRTIRNSAKALIIKEGKIAVIKLRDDDGEWYIMPGGGQEAEETLPSAVCREVAEELGIEVECKELLFVVEGVHGEKFHRVDLVFNCEFIGEIQDAILHNDTNQVGVEWLDISTLNLQPLYPSKLRRQIMNFYENKPYRVYLGNEEAGDVECLM